MSRNDEEKMPTSATSVTTAGGGINIYPDALWRQAGGGQRGSAVHLGPRVRNLNYDLKISTLAIYHKKC